MTDSAEADDHVIDALPPRPDRETGEPFPPHGLSYFRGGEASSGTMPTGRAGWRIVRTRRLALAPFSPGIGRAAAGKSR